MVCATTSPLSLKLVLEASAAALFSELATALINDVGSGPIPAVGILRVGMLGSGVGPPLSLEDEVEVAPPSLAWSASDTRSANIIPSIARKRTAHTVGHKSKYPVESHAGAGISRTQQQEECDNLQVIEHD